MIHPSNFATATYFTAKLTKTARSPRYEGVDQVFCQVLGSTDSSRQLAIWEAIPCPSDLVASASLWAKFVESFATGDFQ